MSIENLRTRRRFLEQLGLIGGSSLVMTALQSWDLMAGQAGVRPQLSGRPSNGSKVLVLGAGDSGMVVGYELGKLGYDYQILEARDRVGGLAFTARSGVEHTEIGGEKQVCTFAPGQYQNMGPWRLPYTHTGVLNYCREVGVAMEMFQNECDNSYFYYEGDQWGPLANKRVRLRQVKSDMWGYTTEMIAKALDQKQLDVPLSAEDRDRFLRFLVNAGFLDSSKAYKGFPPSDENPALPLAAILEAGFDTRIRSAPSTDGTTAAPIFQPVGGMDMFAKGLQNAMAARDGAKRITFNAEVQSVHQDDSGVKVVYADTKNGMKKHEVRADYVVVCLPMTIVSKLDINLSDDIMKIAKTVNHSESAKVGLQTKRRFWEEDDQIFGGHLYSNLPLGEFSYPSYGYYGKKGILLGLYVNGASFNAPSPNAAGRGGGRGGGGANAPAGRGGAPGDAAAGGRAGGPGVPGAPGGAPPAGRGGAPQNTLFRDLGQQPVAARIEHVLTHASKVHPQLRNELESSFAVWWKNVKYSEGSYATGLAAERRQTLSKLDNRIIIGSAAVCPYSAPDWQEGAVAAAWQALKAIHERAMKA